MERKLKTGMFGGESFTYPSDHKMGMKVPYGGSMCANCIYLGTNHNTCTQKEWVKWNGGDNKLPFSDEEYCCDLFSPAIKMNTRKLKKFTG